MRPWPATSLTPRLVAHDLGHQGGVGELPELGQPDTVRVLLEQGAGHLERGPRLAEAAGAGDGHQAVVAKHAGQLQELIGAAEI